MPMPRKPLELKRAQGNPGHQKLPDRTTTMPLDRIPATPPRGSGLGPAGRRLWTQVAGLPWVGTSDAMALLGLAQLADLGQALRDDIQSNGMVCEARGRKYMNPAVAALNETGKLMSTGLSSFGLTPSDRSRLGVGEIKAPSKFELLSMQRQPDPPPPAS